MAEMFVNRTEHGKSLQFGTRLPLNLRSTCMGEVCTINPVLMFVGLLQRGQGKFAKVWGYGIDKVIKVYVKATVGAWQCVYRETAAYKLAKSLWGKCLVELHDCGLIAEVSAVAGACFGVVCACTQWNA